MREANVSHNQQQQLIEGGNLRTDTRDKSPAWNQVGKLHSVARTSATTAAHIAGRRWRSALGGAEREKKKKKTLAFHLAER